MQLTGGHASGAQQAALRVPLWYSCENVVIRGHTGTAAPVLWASHTGAPAPVLWARGCPLASFPLVPINTPWGSSSGRYTEGSVVFFPCCSLG